MFAFPKLREFNSSWADHLRKPGFESRTGHEFVPVFSRISNGVVVESRPTEVEDGEITETSDEPVLAIFVDEANVAGIKRSVLGKTSSW